MGRGRIAFAMLIAPVSACSSPAADGPPPVTADEQRAVADAQAMIPASELPPATGTPAATETASDDE